MKYFKKQFLENVTFELKQVWHGESPQFILSDKRSLNSTPQSLWNSLLLQILWDSFSLYLNRKAVRERAGGQHNKRQHRADLNPGHFDSKWANCSTWWVKPWPQTRLLLSVCENGFQQQVVGQSVFKVRAVYYEKAMLGMSSELQGLLVKTLALISCCGCHLRTVHRHKCLHKLCIQTFHGKISY